MSSGEIASPLRKAAMLRPGGRTLDVTERVFAVTMALLERGGISAVTFQEVAKRAEVGRATLYRRWPDPSYLVGDALAATAAERIRLNDTGSLRGDLVAMLRQIGQFIESPTGRAAIIAALTGREQADFAKHARQLWDRRRKDVALIFERAKQRGELAAGAEGDVLFALAAGALYARTIVMALPIDQAWIAQVVDTVLPANVGRNSASRRQVGKEVPGGSPSRTARS